MDEEKTRNKRIPITVVRATMNQATDMYEEIIDVKVERGRVSSQNLLYRRNASLEAGNFFNALFDAVIVGAFNGRGAGDLVDSLDFDGDGILNVKRKTPKGLTTEALKKVGFARGNLYFLTLHTPKIVRNLKAKRWNASYATEGGEGME
jgi:hypothetical protein